MAETLTPFKTVITVDNIEGIEELSAYIPTVNDFIMFLQLYELNEMKEETQRKFLAALCAIQCALNEIRVAEGIND